MKAEFGFYSNTMPPPASVAATRESLWSLLSTHGFTIRIPLLHREYAHGRPDAETTRIRRKLLDDLSDALREAASDSNGVCCGMDLGFLYGNLTDDRVFVPVDGQQRLITLFLLYWLLAFRSGLLESDTSVREALLRFRFEGRVAVDHFCRQMILQIPSGTSTLPESCALSSELRNCGWFSEDCAMSSSVQGMLVMLDALQARLTALTSAGFTAEQLFSLLVSSRPPVSFLFLNLDDAGLTESIYIKMNARGRPLTFFEGFKASLSGLLDPDTADSFLRQLNGTWAALFWMPEYREHGPFPTTDRPMLRFFRFVILTDFITGIDPVPNRLALRSAITALMSEPDEIFFSRLFRDGFCTVEGLHSEKPPVTARTFQNIRELLDLLVNRKKRTGSLSFLKRSGEPELLFDEESAFRRLIGSEDDRSPGYRDLLLLYAEYRFLLHYARPDGSFHYRGALARWLHLVSNLSGAVMNLQPEVFFRMIRAVDRLVKSGFAMHCRKALLRWPHLPESLSVFPAPQLAEEAVKAALMLSCRQWRRALLDAEHSFLNGRIDMLFACSGIRADDIFPTSSASVVPDSGGPEYALFMRSLRRLRLLFDRHGIRPELDEAALLRRALLCYGGENSYLLPVGRTRLCFLDNTDPEHGFRRLLWDGNGGRRALLMQLLDDLDEKQPAAPQLQRIISQKVFTGSERWKEYLVHMPEILSSVRLFGPDVADPMREWVFQTEKRYIRMNHPDDILLLSRTQTSSVGREYYSYVLFLKARDLGLPVYYHADYTESSEKYAWFDSVHGVRIRILYRNPDGSLWRFLAYPEDSSVPLFAGDLDEMLDYIRSL